MNEEWLNNLRNTIDQHHEPAPEGLWEEIESELFSEEKKRFVFLKPELEQKSKSVFGTYFQPALRVASVALLLLLSKNTVTHQTKASDIQHVFSHLTTEIIQPIASAIPASKEVVKRNVEEIQNSSEILLTKEKRLKMALSTLKNKIQMVAYQPETFPFDVKSIDRKNRELAFLDHPKFPAKKFTASILTGQTNSTSNQQHMGFTSMAAKPYENTPSTKENALTAILDRNSDENVYTDIKHKSPFTAGFSLQYHLNKKLSIGLGLTYTKLVSELQAGSELDNIRSEQTLHYLGIPIQLNYLLFETSKLALYVSSGAAVDKNIGGKLITQYTLNPVSENGPEEKLKDKTLQVSLNTMVGIQYKINSHLGIYLEPGLNYYFSNNSEYSTLFKEKPLMVNTRMGLRVTLNK